MHSQVLHHSTLVIKSFLADKARISELIFMHPCVVVSLSCFPREHLFTVFTLELSFLLGLGHFKEIFNLQKYKFNDWKAPQIIVYINVIIEEYWDAKRMHQYRNVTLSMSAKMMWHMTAIETWRCWHKQCNVTQLLCCYSIRYELNKPAAVLR